MLRHELVDELRRDSAEATKVLFVHPKLRERFRQAMSDLDVFAPGNQFGQPLVAWNTVPT
jgi:hypothetical protein